MAIIAKTRTIKVPDEVWERWQAQAKAAGCSTTALIIDRTEHARDLRDMAQQDAQIRKLDDLIAERDARIAELEAALRVWAPKSRQPNAAPSDGKVVAAVLPVVGTQFPPRPTHLRGQEPGKGKKP